MVDSLRWRRLRWRLKGAWQWPAFVALTVVDAAILVMLPFAGDGADAVGALLLATFFNLLAVALAAPLGGMLLRRVRRDLPRIVARDYMGTAALVAVTVALVLGGLAHRSGLAAEERNLRAVSAAVHTYLQARDPELATAPIDTQRLEPDHYRACVPGHDGRPLCVFVNTNQTPAGVTRDPTRLPNPR